MSQFSGEMFAGSSTVTGNAPIDAHYLLTLANSALINAVVVGSYPFGTTDIANNAITDGKILGPITISKLSSYPFVNADIAVTAAIAYSKLNLAGSIQGTDFPNQNRNLVFAGPQSGAAAVPSFRKLVASDMPTALQHALLDAFYNKDTVASAPVRGGIITANSTPAWAQVPLAAAGQYLRSNGTDLLYSALLMGDASGILDVVNGGTGSSAFTAGSVIFSNGTILTQNNANLFWDNTNLRLGIGTTAPGRTLEVISPASDSGDCLRLNKNAAARTSILFDSNAGQQASLRFSDAGTDKWVFGKQTDNTFFIYDILNNKTFLIIDAVNKYLSFDPGVVPYKVGIGTSSPNTTLDVRGSLSVNLVVKSVNNYTMTATDFAVIANGSNGAFTVTLPPANTEAGMFTFVIKSDGTSNVITVAAAGTDNIDGVASKGLNIQHESLLLISDGVGVWYSVGANTLPKDVSDSELTTTNATTVASFTPTSQGNFLVLIYFRVTTALTTVTISITYNDGTGAQTITPVNAAAEPVGSYTLVPVFINATTGAAIAVSATAGTANQVFVSASIQPV